MITHRFRFVKNFFQVFSNFFEALSFAALSRLSLPASQPTRLGYHIQFALSRAFFKFFQTFFELLTCEPFGPLRFRPVLPCRRALAYISKTVPVCQHLFSFFSSFFPLSFPRPYLRPYVPFLPQNMLFSQLFISCALDPEPVPILSLPRSSHFKPTGHPPQADNNPQKSLLRKDTSCDTLIPDLNYI